MGLGEWGKFSWIKVKKVVKPLSKKHGYLKKGTTVSIIMGSLRLESAENLMENMRMSSPRQGRKQIRPSDSES